MLLKGSLMAVNVGAEAGGRAGQNERASVSDLRLGGRAESRAKQGRSASCLTRNYRFLCKGQIHGFDVSFFFTMDTIFFSSRLGEFNRDIDSEHILL